MPLLAAARRWIADAAARSTGMRERGEPDPADMGTAFGLDAIAGLERDAARPAAVPGATPPAGERPWSPFEPRPPRRSLY